MPAVGHTEQGVLDLASTLPAADHVGPPGKRGTPALEAVCRLGRDLYHAGRRVGCAGNGGG